ncbi:MAG: neuraminidase-like domain-containing protein, partial [Acidobacteriota bacterium]
DEVERIVGRPIDPALVPDAEGLAALLIAEVAAEEVTSFTAGVFTVLDGVSDATSRALLDADPAAFEAVGERFRTTAGYAPSTPLVLPADDVEAGIVVPAALRADPTPLHDVLDASRPATLIALRAPTLLDARPDAFMAAADLLGLDLGAAAMADALRGDAVATPLVDLLAGVAPLAELFADDALDADRLDFVQANAAGLFALVDPAAPTVDTVRRVDTYAAWAGRLERRDLAPDLDDLLTTFDPATGFAAADPALLASVLDGEPSLATSVHDTVTLASEAFAALADLEAGVALARRLSVGGVALAQMTSDVYDDVAAASQALQAGLRAKYVDDEEWEEKIEPFRDRVLSRRRDGLAAFLIYSSAPEFDSIEDLYRYFLIDVQLEGCARTSRVVSANSTLQLYVQRVLMNLEETPAGHADPIHAAPDLVDRDEWSWRKNYRVWEANRRVFLFPENYLLPELRDNKTPLFEQLEEALASQDVNSETVRDAYAAYLRGFEEVSRLRIAGAHHEKDDDAKQDVLHLFGVTADDPPIHYYRRVENLIYGTTEPGRATEWGVWREIDAKISARTVSPIIHQGRLFLFWVEVATNPRQKIEDGSAEFDGYNHKFKLQFATRKLDGSWAAPQTVRMDRDPFHFGDGVVVDEVWGSSVLYSRETHTEAKDGYTLRGFAWDKVYPSHWDRAGNDLVLRGFDYQLNAKLDLYERRMGETLTSGIEDVWVPWVDPASALFIILFGGRWGFPSSRILWSQLEGGDRVLRHGSPGLPFCGNEAFASLVIERERYLDVSRNRSGYDYLMHGPTSPPIDDRWRTPLRDVVEAVFDGPSLITFDGAAPRLSVINGAENHGLIDVEGALFVLFDGLRGDDRYLLRRLNTSLSEDIARTLFTRGVDAMLDIETQEALAEHPLDFDLKSRVADETRVGEVDYDGPAGVYLREIYFHVPVTIAQHLARQGDYEEARDWFHYVFDPTANEVIADIDPGLSERDRQRRALDRNWRYREFRGREVESLRDVLENESAVETYKNDPFNPHAIARLRLSAYQKWVVLAYVDNLLDWADSLFATDLREQIGEATLLYINALDILGGRPAQLGDCGDKIGEGLSYGELEDQIADDPDLLLEIETFHIGRRLSRAAGGRRTAAVVDAARDRTA